MTRYATALSYIALAGTALYCSLGDKRDLPQLYFSKAAFNTILFHSLIGIWRWGNPSYGQQTDWLYKRTSLIQDLIVLPCIVTTIWLQYNYMAEVAYTFTIIRVPFLYSYMTDKSRVSSDLWDIVIGIYCATLFIVSLIQQNYYGVVASISYTFSHFYIKDNDDDETYFSGNSQDFFNYTLCFFAFFSLKAVMD